MNFTYTIQYQNKQSRTVTVLFTPEDQRALDVIRVISYEVGATEQDIHATILTVAPTSEWENAIAEADVTVTPGAFPSDYNAVLTARMLASPPPTFAQQQVSMATNIDTWRLRNEAKGLQYSFPPSDTPDIIQLRYEQDFRNINGLVSAAIVLSGQGVTDPVFQFRADSNTSYNMTPAQVIAMGTAVSTRVSNLYEIAWKLKEQAASATTIDELNTIQWPVDA